MKRLLKRLPLLVLLALLAAGLVYSFQPRPVPVDLGTVSRGPMKVTVDEDGRTRVKDKYVISAPLLGRMIRVGLKPGDSVEAGKTLLTVVEPADPTLLDPRTRAEAEMRVQTARARLAVEQGRLDKARASQREAEELEALARTKKDRAVAAPRTVSDQEMDTLHREHRAAVSRKTAADKEVLVAERLVALAKTEVALAEAALIPARPRAGDDDARTRPKDYNGNGRLVEIYSPVDGKVLRVHEESATVVTPGKPVIEIGDPRNQEVVVDMISQDAAKVRPGQKVELVHWGGDQPLKGKVRLVEPSGFLKISALGVEEQRVNVVIDFESPLEQREHLGDSFRVVVRIIIWESQNALKVPAGALFRHNGEHAVWAVVAGKATRRLVKVLHNNGLEAEIEGLQEGDTVILHPSDKIKEGVAVTARESS